MTVVLAERLTARKITLLMEGGDHFSTCHKAVYKQKSDRLATQNAD